jgi:hypothetical protein
LVGLGDIIDDKGGNMNKQFPAVSTGFVNSGCCCCCPLMIPLMPFFALRWAVLKTSGKFAPK